MPVTDSLTVCTFDSNRRNPVFFRRLERRIDDLFDLGIEADLILFHPCDRWGFISMDAASDGHYLRWVHRSGLKSS